jgi:hypothetical protein
VIPFNLLEFDRLAMDPPVVRSSLLAVDPERANAKERRARARGTSVEGEMKFPGDILKFE